MQGLPKVRYTGNIQSSTQTAFGGLNHRSSASDGEIYDMRNMTSDEYPLLTPRKPRYLISSQTDSPNGIFALDGLLEVYGTQVYYKDALVGEVTDSPKIISALGSKIVILPDKVYYDTATAEFVQIESTTDYIDAVIQDGEYAGVEAKANTIYSKGINWKDYFKVGDAVKIDGAFLHTQNNTTIVVREIDGEYLRFYENSFIIGKNGDTENLRLLRMMPDMDFICECDNRMWGCKGDTVYASKLGDVTNWNVFDGLASDSYAVDVGTPGDFTGCITYLGYPCFFKEDVIYKAYGSQPSNFQMIRSASLGVAPGNSKSLAVAGEILFYMSRTGIVGYSGSTPYDIFLPFGEETFTNCVGGSDGKKYYVSMQCTDKTWLLAVYDTSFGTWHIEDNTQVVGFTYFEGLHMLDSKGQLWKAGQSYSNYETALSSMVEFADCTMSVSNKKTVTKIALRCTIEDDARLTVQIQYDSSGAWKDVRTLNGNGKRSYYLPIIPRRCDHFKIRLIGTGEWKLYSVTREYSYGSIN